MNNEVAGCKVISEADGLSFLRGSKGDALRFSDYQVRELVMYLSAYLRHDRTIFHNGSQTALLMGGPKHGEFVELPHQDRILQYVTAPPFKYNTDEPVADQVEFTTHIYEKFPDIQVLGGVRLPFAIYEHTSLNKANAERRAKQLDDERNALERQLRINKQEIQHAKTAKKSAENFLGVAADREAKAQLAANATLKKFDATSEERTQIAFDHGI